MVFTNTESNILLSTIRIHCYLEGIKKNEIELEKFEYDINETKSEFLKNLLIIKNKDHEKLTKAYFKEIKTIKKLLKKMKPEDKFNLKKRIYETYYKVDLQFIGWE